MTRPLSIHDEREHSAFGAVVFCIYVLCLVLVAVGLAIGGIVGWLVNKI